MTNARSFVSLNVSGNECAVSYTDNKNFSKPILLFIHGNSSSSETFSYQCSFFNDDYRVIALDLLGHGESAQLVDIEYSLELMGQLLVQFTQTLGLRDVYLFGHSLGGHVAIQALRELESDLAGLFIWGTPALGNPPDITLAFSDNPTMVYFFSEVATEEEITMLYREANKKYDQSDLEKFLEDYQKTDPKCRSQITKNLGNLTYRNELTELSEFSKPVYVLHGRDEKFVRLEYVKGFSDVSIISDSGHYAHRDNSEEFNKKVLEFLTLDDLKKYDYMESLPKSLPSSVDRG